MPPNGSGLNIAFLNDSDDLTSDTITLQSSDPQVGTIGEPAGDTLFAPGGRAHYAEVDVVGLRTGPAADVINAQPAPTMNGTAITLDKNADGSIDATAITGPDGSYSFTDVDPGTYRVREQLVVGWVQTTADPIDLTLRSGTAATRSSLSGLGGIRLVRPRNLTSTKHRLPRPATLRSSPQAAST